MATETERKFLVVSDEWRENAVGVTYKQGYLNSDKERTVRIRLAGDDAYLTIKGPPTPDGVSKAEYEYMIPRKDAEEMLHNLCLPSAIDKVRHKVMHEGHLWEIDVFKGDNDGLIMAEIELTSPDEKFVKPVWAGEEVTHDPRYSNAQLSKAPYKSWKP